MKSAIFQGRQSLQPRTAHKNSARKRPQTQSPQIGPSHGPSFSSWSLDDLITNYTVSGSLPTPLSPTLPPRFDLKKFEPEDNEHEEDDDSNDSDIEGIPLLPPASQGPKIVQPTPKAPAKVKSIPPQSAPQPIVTKSGNVKILNKLNDLERPRLLVRINYKALLSRLKSKFTVKSGDESSATKSVDTPRKEPEIKGKKELDVRHTNPWLKTVKDLQTQCDRVAKTDFFFSVVLQFDSIMCSVIANLAEEKLKLSRSILIDRWQHIHSSIPLFVSRIEKHLKTNTVSDKMKSMLSFLVAILAIARALILKRVNYQLELQIDQHNKDNGLDSKQKICDLQRQVIENHHKMEDNFAQSQSFFSLSPPPATVFPHSWHNRASSIPRPSGLILCPSSDKYFLPLGSYSDIREALAYLHCCVREFGEIFGSEINGGVRYTLQSGQKRPR